MVLATRTRRLFELDPSPHAAGVNESIQHGGPCLKKSTVAADPQPMTDTLDIHGFVEPIRAYGDITAIRAKFRRLIRRGQGLIDEIEGGRRTLEPETGRLGPDFFFAPVVFTAAKSLGRWQKSVAALLEAHVPTLKEAFLQRPVIQLDENSKSANLLDAYEAYLRTTIDDLEAIAGAITNKDPE